MSDHLLSIAIWLPILGGVAVLATGGDARAALARRIGLIVAVGAFFATWSLYLEFDRSSGGMQFSERWPWIETFSVYYHLGIDGIALPLILLTSFITVLVMLAGWRVIESRVAQYYGAFLIMEGLMIGVFSALDAILFYAFWEAMLVPMFLIIGIWGGPNRIYATIKFFLYTFLGSLLMLVAFVYLYYQAGHSFDLQAYYELKLTLPVQIALFFAFFAAFAVKVPMWPVHTWLPDAHVEAPTGGSVVLAAVMLKMGAYGFIRFNLPMLPDASHALAGFMIALSLIAIVYIGFVALMQEDLKKLIAYSSIAHMGFVTLGFFLFNSQGIEGALVQMISHGFVSGALFLCVGVLYDRMHSRMIKDYSGVANQMPLFAAFMMLFAMANAGLPGTSGFVGELLVILGAFPVNFGYALLAGTSLILGAAYTLWMYKRVVFGPVASAQVQALTDINGREAVVLTVLALAVIGMGLWPYPVLDVMHMSVERVLQQAMTSKLL